jgi:hypothetical protein
MIELLHYLFDVAAIEQIHIDFVYVSSPAYIPQRI